MTFCQVSDECSDCATDACRKMGDLRPRDVAKRAIFDQFLGRERKMYKNERTPTTRRASHSWSTLMSLTGCFIALHPMPLLRTG